MAQVCDGCRFYDARNKVCRRYPPQVIIKQVLHANHLTSYTEANHPKVEPDHWCGEYKFAQNRIVDCIGCGRRTRSKEQLCPSCLKEVKSK